jgi:hypothetical protein
MSLPVLTFRQAAVNLLAKDYDEVLAEIERLQHDLADLQMQRDEHMIDSEHAHSEGIAGERAKVVAWLRAKCGSPGHEDKFCAYCNVRRNIAAEVEQGVHREPEEYAIGYNVWKEKT